MKASRFLYIVYDIKDDQKRSELSRRLIYYGLSRVQLSTFKGEVFSIDKNRIIEEIKNMDLDEGDKVTILDLCESCRRQMIVFGKEDSQPQHLIF